MTISRFRALQFLSLICLLSLLLGNSEARTNPARTLSGVIVTDKNEAVAGASIIVRSSSGELKVVSDANGEFSITVPDEPLAVRVEGKNLEATEKLIAATDSTENLQLKVKYIIPPVHESIVIQATTLDPTIDRRNDTIYKDSLFVRDDQLVQTLNAGINVGQHEGGGKSLEVRRFGYNLDHGGVGGGLKFLVDDVQQNQGTQGHGQGYLGQLKSLTPELVQDVDILNGPFSVEYGDFSGLGVVHIRLKESLPDQLTLRGQGGSFNSRRGFFAYSPQLKDAASFIAYEPSYTDGPFKNPGRYRRDNVTGNYTYNLSEREAVGFKLNFGRNRFFSSGQIPLDLVSEGALDRFGFIDPSTGGRVRTGIFGTYYRKEWRDGSIVKADGFVSRSLFDLFSNFTFFLDDEVNGDGIQQHDSRLQEGGTLQYIHPYRLFGRQMLFIAGGNVHATQANVGLYKEKDRVPFLTTTKADAHITNTAGYVQQGIYLFGDRLHLDAGVRFDYFRFSVEDKINPQFSGHNGQGRFQPKVNAAYTPSKRLSTTFYLNYGRGINSQDARGVARGAIKELPNPDNPAPGADGEVGPPVATTDFYQFGISHNMRRFSVSGDMFLIDHSNEQVYIPDDGTTEFAGPSRSSGYELKTSVQITRHLSFNAGLTQVMNAYFRGTRPRVYVDSAPHTVGNAGLILANFHGFTASLLYRHVSNYRLDGEDARIRASGLDVLDFSITKKLRRWVDINFAIDNLTDKHYFETQNFFESRARPGAPVIARVHGTPGYSIGVLAGLTFHLFGK
ncbi:MAG TPA: TonB-dependent receptor [Blastocatellia bacterium]|nr:TonB-dependent receptor [Blastocatellia bacterium]